MAARLTAGQLQSHFGGVHDLAGRRVALRCRCACQALCCACLGTLAALACAGPPHRCQLSLSLSLHPPASALARSQYAVSTALAYGLNFDDLMVLETGFTDDGSGEYERERGAALDALRSGAIE